LPAVLVGIDQTGGDRSATINGLPQNAVKLTIDGIDVKPVQGDNATSSFYAYIYPAADAMEAVTVTSGQDASNSGDGTASVRFVTKGGTDRYSGSFFEYFRHNSLNTNYFFNDLHGLPKDVATIHNYGATVGGPIQISSTQQRQGILFRSRNYSNPTAQLRHDRCLPAGSSGVTHTTARSATGRSVATGRAERPARHSELLDCGLPAQIRPASSPPVSFWPTRNPIRPTPTVPRPDNCSSPRSEST
jgi:hypothetical protein